VFDIIVIGGTNIDIKAKTTSAHVAVTSNPGDVTSTSGGVARNVAHNLGLLGMRVALISVIGRDAGGQEAIASTLIAGVDLSMTQRSELPTGSYVAVLDHNGELVTAVNDMRILDSLTPGLVKQYSADLDTAKYIVADCNIRQDLLEWLALHHGDKLIVEPVSVAKSQKLKVLLDKHEVFLATPNRDQLAALMEGGTDLHECGLQNLVIHMGQQGVIVSSESGTTQIPSIMQPHISDVTGAGDASVAGLVYGLVKGYDIPKAAQFGQAAASLVLNTTSSIAVGLSERALEAIVKAGNE
jgi:pseudouridine kinase